MNRYLGRGTSSGGASPPSPSPKERGVIRLEGAWRKNTNHANLHEDVEK